VFSFVAKIRLMRKISFYGLISIFALRLLFHFLVLMHVVPSTIVSVYKLYFQKFLQGNNFVVYLCLVISKVLPIFTSKLA
jgi:hypothetical protein